MFTNDNHRIVYDRGEGENLNWILSEDQLSVQRLAKCESIMCQGNGYLCMRGGLFEAPSEDVGPVTMIAGTFNHHEGDGCMMLINSANPLSVVAVINGERMGYDNIDYTTHTRSLNLRNGLLERRTEWKGKDGARYLCEEKRLVSLKDRHLAAQKVTVTALTDDCEITLMAGINGKEELIRLNQHLVPVTTEAFGGTVAVNTRTSQSGIRISTVSSVKFSKCSGENKTELSEITYSKEELSAYGSVTVSLKAGESITVSKKIAVYTSRDQ